MEAKKFKTSQDLMASEEERVELINGEIVKRPMARFEHGAIQSNLAAEFIFFDRKSGSGEKGWWISSDVSVRYSQHQCPSHDLAGWRREREPNRPTGVIEIIPDWVCEITSPGHERKDVFHLFILLKRYKVPYYWIISPEDKTLIAYQLVNENYHEISAIECREPEGLKKVRIPPFEEVEIDLRYIFGE